LAVRRNPAELKALTEARIHAIFLPGRSRTAEWTIKNLRAANRNLVDLISNATEPLHLAVMAGGKVERLTSPLARKGRERR
jgi:hypothetical protein